MTQANFKVKKGDLVEVRTGAQKGKRGVVLKVFLDEARVIVDGLPEVRRNIRPSQQNPSGFIMKKRPIHISNVALVDNSTGLSGKVGYKVVDDEKVRFFKKSGTILKKS